MRAAWVIYATRKSNRGWKKPCKVSLSTK